MSSHIINDINFNNIGNKTYGLLDFLYDILHKHNNNNDSFKLDPLNSFIITIKLFPDNSNYIDILDKYKLTKDLKDINITYFVLKVTIPHLKVDTEIEEVQYIGKYPVTGKMVYPDSNNLTLDILNTKNGIIDYFFYDWMKNEVTSTKWIYDEQPYTTATISISLESHTDIIYKFIGCRPVDIENYNPDQASPSGMTRQVTFVFDYMLIINTNPNPNN